MQYDDCLNFSSERLKLFIIFSTSFTKKISMKNRSLLQVIAALSVVFLLTALSSCKNQYNISVQQIDSLLNANQEVHILLPEGTNIELVESGSKKRGENQVPGTDGNTQMEKDVFSGIRQTMGTAIMNAYAGTSYKCPPYCEIIL